MWNCPTIVDINSMQKCLANLFSYPPADYYRFDIGLVGGYALPPGPGAAIQPGATQLIALCQYNGLYTFCKSSFQTFPYPATLPVAHDVTVFADPIQPTLVDLTVGATGTPTSATLVGGLTQGSLSGLPLTSVLFTPASSWEGIASFEFSLSNAKGTSNTATALMVSAPQKQLGMADPGACTCDLGTTQAAIHGNPQVGDPITVGTGNVYESATDYQTAGANPLAFTRSYNSLAGPISGLLGRNWRSNYDRVLQLTMSAGGQITSVTALRADGQGLTFTPSGSAWISDSDVDLKLVQSGSTWTLTDSNDGVETYTTTGTTALLTSVTTRDGYTQALSYDANNNLTTVADSFGRSLAFTVQNGLIQTVTTPDGLVFAYGYTASVSGGALDRLASVNYSTNPATSQSYVYENPAFPFALTGLIDENGNRFSTWAYDSYGRGTSSQHAGGADLTTIAYNDTDGSRTVTNAGGEQEVYKFATLQGVPKVVEIDRLATGTTAAATKTFTYDANGYLASQTDWNGNLTTYVNDPRGLPTKITEAVGAAASRRTNISWRGQLHLPLEIITPGLKTDFTYNDQGEQVSHTDTDTTNGVSRLWTSTWAHHQLASVQGPRTDVTQQTSYTYDSRGRLTAATNALGQTTKIIGHLPGGLPTIIIDPNGVRTELTYDARLRLIKSHIVTSGGPRTTLYSYDAAGNLTRVTLPDGSFLANSYDAAHRLTGTADALGNPISFKLDALGDRTLTSIAAAGAGAVWQDSGAFDALGRLLQDTRGAGQTTVLRYDGNGNVLAKVDPLSRTTHYGIDTLNRVTKIIDPAGGVATFTYDPHDRPTSVTAPNGAVTTYVYDGFGRVTKRISPDTGTTFYTYDLADNLTQMTDGAGVITRHTYDALNRPTSTSYPGNAAENVAFHYDEAGHGFGVGHLTSVADAVGTLSLTYDEQGNELGETRKSGAVTLATLYGYDLASRIAAITYPSGSQAIYAHDAAGRVASVKLNVGGTTKTLVASVTYKPFGPVAGMTYGNGIVETRAYDGDYRLTGLTTGAVQALGYSYFANNNVKSIKDNVAPAKSQTFSYDVLDHLTAASGIYGSLAWTYDLVGNRTGESAGGASSAAYAYLANSNRLTGITAGGQTQTLSYTGTGNIAGLAPATGAATTLSYNQAERLASVAKGGTTVAGYAYDAFGRRFSKTLPTSTALFQYDQTGRLLEETNGQGAPKTDTVYLNGVPVASIPAGGGVSYLHTDRLGTPQIATNGAKTPDWGATYEPFGALDGLPSGSITQNLRFPGQYADAETGWYQNGFRDYAPLWGRYLESDPIGLTGGMSTYNYVNANPSSGTDSMGLWSVSFDAYDAIGGGVTFGIDDKTGQVFWAVQAGFGLGGGFDLDPSGSRPGKPNCKETLGGGVVSVFAKYDVSAVGFEYEKKGSAGLEKNIYPGPISVIPELWSQPVITPFSTPFESSQSLVRPRFKLDLGASAGVEISGFGKNDCSCQNTQ